MRIAFLGTPAFAVPILEALALETPAGSSLEIIKVYAQPARPTGRGHRIMPSAVERRARELGLPVETPLSLRDPAEAPRFAALDLDVAVVAAFGQILPERILTAPRLGCINVHASLLPRWRGAAPIQRAILAGDETTGVSIMQMALGLDTGPVLLARSLPITPGETATSLQGKLSALGTTLIIEVISGLARGDVNPTVQSEIGVTYAHKLAREEAALSWHDTATTNERKVRALNPSPGVWFAWHGERIKVLEATEEPGTAPAGTVIDQRLGIACSAGIFRPRLLQRAGRAPVETEAFLRGLPIAAGTVLACPATS